MKETPLEAALRTIPAIYSIHISDNLSERGGGLITVKDCVGTDVLILSLYPSGVRACLTGRKFGPTILKGWDLDKVDSRVIFEFYSQATTNPVKSYEASILHEIQSSHPVLPLVITDVVNHLFKLYTSVQSGLHDTTVKEAQKVLKKLSKLGFTEDDLMKEWRNIVVSEIHES